MSSPKAGPSRHANEGGNASSPPSSPPSPSTESILLTISHRGSSHELRLPSDATLKMLREEIQAVTDVPVAGQKLLPPRSRGIKNLDSGSDEALLTSFGLVPTSSQPLKIMLLGTSDAELSKMRSAENEAARRNAPRQYHPSMLRGAKPRSTATASKPNPFGTIEAHPSTPPSSPLHDKVISYLRRLAYDPAVVHVCSLHGYSVGILTELLPHEHPELLGLNENMGQRISLRIRTDDYEGFRDYKTSRRVLLHELAHNDVNDHPPEFKILNSELNAQVEAYERSVASGRHTLLGPGDMYEPETGTGTGSSGVGLEGGAYVLGGSGRGASDAGSVSLEERRRKVLQATMSRIEKLEREIEKGCGAR